MIKLKDREIIVVADDFGISPGVNQSIIKAHKNGILTHASIMISSDFVSEAIKLSKENKELKIGLHIDLMSNKYASKKTNLIVNGFFDLVRKSYLMNRSKFIRQIYREINAQILKAKDNGIEINYLDSHIHTHMIPIIFKITKRLAKKHKINRIRIVNESLAHTIFSKPNFWSMVKNLGIVKYFILKTFYYINNEVSEYYFCSILNSCCISSRFITNLKVPKKYQKVEIMLHPGFPVTDRSYKLPKNESDHLLSLNRLVELKAALQLKGYIDEN